MGSQYIRDLLALQLADWNRMQSDSYLSEERLRIFALLAGKPVRRKPTDTSSSSSSSLNCEGGNNRCLLQVWQSSDSVVNVCSELDWKRCVAVHLWFMLPPTASVADALTKYEAAFQVTSPTPPLCGSMTSTGSLQGGFCHFPNSFHDDFTVGRDSVRIYYLFLKDPDLSTLN